MSPLPKIKSSLRPTLLVMMEANKKSEEIEREVFFPQFKLAAKFMRDSYRTFMTEMKRYQVSERDLESIFRGKGEVDELVERARQEGRLLWDDDDPMARYWWTHGECNLVALMLRTVLVNNFGIVANVNYVADDEEDVATNYHALVEFELHGQTYYSDGLLYSTNYEDVYRGKGQLPKESNLEQWKENLFATDPCGMVLFSTWCELFKLDVKDVIWDWEHPVMLSSGRDIDEYYALFCARYKVLTEHSIDGEKTVAQAYKAGK